MTFLQDLLKVGEVARWLDVKPRRVYQLIRKGILPAVHLGRQVRVSRAALSEFVRGGGKRLDGKWRKVPADRLRESP